MIIDSLELKNIRSYENETIKFPKSSFLILGDIGSGKTSLLLAIEFAIFGLRRGELAGSGLLRHGKKQGSVRLSFSIGNKKITIKRTLKKTSSGIQQDSGYIVIDGKKTEGSALELKSKIFHLLGYPEEMVSKSKSLIYRYTVYTPQEMMKSILMEDKDERLNTLRKIFDIDKYKTIKENSVLYIRELKNKKKNMDEKTESLSKNKDELNDKNKKIEEIQKKIENLNKNLEEIKTQRNKTEDEREKNKENIKRYNELKQEIVKNSSGLENKEETSKKNKENILYYKKKTETLEKEISSIKLPDVDEKVLTKKIREKSEEYQNLKDKIKEKLNILKTKKGNSVDIIKKIIKMDKCPTCLRDVNEEHKQKIKYKENKNINDFNKAIDIYEKKIPKIENKLEELRQKTEKLHKLKIKIKDKELKERNLKEKLNELSKIKEENHKINNEILLLNKKIKELRENIEKYSETEEKQNAVEEKLSEIIEKQKDIEIKRAESKKEEENLKERISELKKKTEEQEKIRQNIEYIKQLTNWLEDYFINLMSEMEKNILMKIYHQFNEYFMEWFHILIEEEELQVRLNEDFSPVITQNGYDTAIDNLSGGEKTSLALSYRLALNQVINDFITRIKTKNLIILDEPTDGFSNTQLDKIKDIIDSLKIKQIIIISHDNKIEGYVDNILKIEKHNHLSRCLTS